MEGLIPLVYKSLKKNMTRRQYECLSTGSAQTYNAADFYAKDDDHHHHFSRQVYATPSREPCHTKDDEDDHHHFSRQVYATPSREPKKVTGLRGNHHRRYNSVQLKGLALEDGAAKQKQLVRFRSHRMFSCVTGA